MKIGDPRIYAEIEYDDFRGEGFFYATYIGGEQWVDAVPPDWKVRYSNDEPLVIVERLDDEWYKLVGGWKERGINKWCTPLNPKLDGDHYYRMHKDWLTDIHPRLAGGK